MGSTSADVARARDNWLAAALERLSVAPGVAGVALVGSLGRGDADDWSDVDLLVLAHNEPASAVPPARLRALGQVGTKVRAPQNTRADARYFGAGFVVDGILVHTDWYVFPVAGAEWPVDSLPVIGTERA